MHTETAQWKRDINERQKKKGRKKLGGRKWERQESTGKREKSSTHFFP